MYAWYTNWATSPAFFLFIYLSLAVLLVLALNFWIQIIVPPQPHAQLRWQVYIPDFWTLNLQADDPKIVYKFTGLMNLSVPGAKLCPKICILIALKHRIFWSHKYKSKYFFVVFVFLKQGLFYAALAIFKLTFCRPSWPWITEDPPASSSQILELEVCATIPDSKPFERSTS